MTAREHIARRVKIWNRLSALASVAMLVSLLITMTNVTNASGEWLMFVFFPSFIVSVFTALLAMKRTECPRCAKSLALQCGSLSPRLGGVARAVRYCPFCGIDVDSDMTMTNSEQAGSCNGRKPPVTDP